MPGPTASQTLGRGLDVLEQVAAGPVALTVIAARLGLSRSTVHRLATSLLERRYLNLASRRGYSLGPKLLELGSIAGEQIGLVRAARPIMESLAAATGDAVLLAVRDGDDAVLVDWVPGTRRIAPSMRVGERQDLLRSAPGRALLLGLGDRDLSVLQRRAGAAPVANFMSNLRADREMGMAVDDGVTDPETSTMAAPVLGADGQVRGALALTSAATYRPQSLGPAAAAALRRAAAALSDELGWRAGPGARATAQAGAATAELAQTGGVPEGAAPVDAEHELLNSGLKAGQTVGPAAGQPKGETDRAMVGEVGADTAPAAGDQLNGNRPGNTGHGMKRHGMKGQDA